MGWQLGVHESVLIEILNSTQVTHLGVFIDFLISHSNAHLSYTRNDKDLCDVVWVDQNSSLTSVSANEILRIALITAVGLYPLRGFDALLSDHSRPDFQSIQYLS